MYGYYYLMFATFPTLFTETYGFSTGIAGLVSHQLNRRVCFLMRLQRHILVRVSDLSSRHSMDRTLPMGFIGGFEMSFMF